MDVMQLYVLPGGDVANSVRIFLSHVREDVHLIRVQATKWNLDALHPRRVPHRVGALGRRGRERQALVSNAIVSLTVVVALAVGTPAQPGLAKQLALDLAVLLELDLPLVHVDFTCEISGHPTCEAFFPACQSEHPRGLTTQW